MNELTTGLQSWPQLERELEFFKSFLRGTPHTVDYTYSVMERVEANRRVLNAQDPAKAAYLIEEYQQIYRSVKDEFDAQCIFSDNPLLGK